MLTDSCPENKLNVDVSFDAIFVGCLKISMMIHVRIDLWPSPILKITGEWKKMNEVIVLPF